jgi:hypothetical protein
MAVELIINIVTLITIVIGIGLFVVAMLDINVTQERLIEAQKLTKDVLTDILNVLEYDIGDKVPDKKLKAPIYDKVSEGYHGN